MMGRSCDDLVTGCGHERNAAVGEALYEDIGLALRQARGRIEQADNARARVVRVATRPAVSRVREVSEAD